MKNNTELKIKIVDCKKGDCWENRTKTDTGLNYQLMCLPEKCDTSDEYENCESIEGKTLCKKCSTKNRCNIYKLDGKAKASSKS